MKKSTLFLFISVFIFTIFFSGLIFAEEEVGDKIPETCDMYCNDFWMSAMPICPGEQATKGEYPDCECGWECFEEDFKDNPDLMSCVDDCKLTYDLEEVRSKCIGGCKADFGFEDGPSYMCEDMNEKECESAEGCESIFGSSLCEGEVCTTDMAWQGCRYEGDEFFVDYKDEELEQEAGTTPASNFYFIDKFFDRFGDELEVKEERIAEIKVMVESGDLESAKVALKDYMELAEGLEQEIDPERKEEAKRSAAAIRATMKDIRDQLPAGERGKFVSGVMSKEYSIATSAEISSKIKQLCVELSDLDPAQYSKTCKSDDDAPKWKKDLDKDLTEEQKQEARKFGKIMSECFETSGQNCACEEISFYDFSVACSKAAPLAVACDIKGDENACDDLDNLEMPELPDYLQDVFKDIEDKYGEDKYDMHMPKECVDAGVTNPKECGKVMIKEHAPLECRAALLEANIRDEREGRKICERIMFEKHAPRECIDKGITSPDECADFMETFRGPMKGPGPGGFGPPGRDCMGIESTDERLKCFESAVGDMGEHYGTGERFDEDNFGEITWQCKENRIHWGPDCATFMRDEWPEQERMRMKEGEERRATEEDWRVKEKECANSCDLVNGWWDFRDGECVCYETEGTGPKPGEYGSEDYVGDDFYTPNYDCSTMDCGETSHCDGDQGCVPNEYAPGEGPGEPGDFDYVDSGGVEEGYVEPTIEDTTAAQSTSTIEDTTAAQSTSTTESSTNEGLGEGDNFALTGGVVSEDNAFLEYYFGP